MSKKKILVKMESYGLYTKFEKEGDELPDIVEFTHKIPARTDVEFGFILNIKRARGQILQFRIDHPPFKDENDKTAPPFEDEIFIDSNDYNFYLGDTLWEPVEDKCGQWKLTCYLKDEVIAEETFEILPEDRIVEEK